MIRYLPMFAILAFFTFPAWSFAGGFDTTDAFSSYSVVQQTFGNKAMGYIWWNTGAQFSTDSFTTKSYHNGTTSIRVNLTIYDLSGDPELEDPVDDAFIVAQSYALVGTTSTDVVFPLNGSFSYDRYYLFAFTVDNIGYLEAGVDLWVANANPVYDMTWYFADYDDWDFSNFDSLATYELTGLYGSLTDTDLTANEYLVTVLPCNTDSRNNDSVVCGNLTASTSLDVSGYVVTEALPRKIELALYDLDNYLLSSVGLFTNGEAGTIDFDHTFAGVSASSTYKLVSCLLDADTSSSFLPDVGCTITYFGNGLATSSVTSLLVEKGIRLPEATAQSWLDAPLQTANGIVTSVLRTIFPVNIPYAVYDGWNSYVATATSSFGVSMDMSAFGLPQSTSTIPITAMAQKAKELSPDLFDAIDKVLWGLFVLFLAVRVVRGT